MEIPGIHASCHACTRPPGLCICKPRNVSKLLPGQTEWLPGTASRPRKLPTCIERLLASQRKACNKMLNRHSQKSFLPEQLCLLTLALKQNPSLASPAGAWGYSVPIVLVWRTQTSRRRSLKVCCISQFSILLLTLAGIFCSCHGRPEQEDTGSALGPRIQTFHESSSSMFPDKSLRISLFSTQSWCMKHSDLKFPIGASC